MSQTPFEPIDWDAFDERASIYAEKQAGRASKKEYETNKKEDDLVPSGTYKVKISDVSNFKGEKGGKYFLKLQVDAPNSEHNGKQFTLPLVYEGWFDFLRERDAKLFIDISKAATGKRVGFAHELKNCAFVITFSHKKSDCGKFDNYENIVCESTPEFAAMNKDEVPDARVSKSFKADKIDEDCDF